MTSPTGYDSLEDMEDILEQEQENSSPKKAKTGGKKAKVVRSEKDTATAALTNREKIASRELLIEKNTGKMLGINSTISKIEAQIKRCEFEIWKTKKTELGVRAEA